MNGTFDFGSVKKLFSGKLKGEKGRKLLVIAGIAGIALILLSDFWPSGGGTQTAAAQETTNAEYAEQLEQKLSVLIGNISGVGKSEIMVTLENGVEYVYANEERKTTDKTEDISDSTQRVQQSNDVEQNVITVDDASGGKKALVRTQIEPQVKGVVVVCEGGDQELVQQRVTNAVTTALNITSRRVCVTKLNPS
ncbi:MAG: stage III sporulation protein AG [Clostridiales bacterium]|nr:stage III sporulation protein AG [Clostridiales bacterium]